MCQMLRSGSVGFIRSDIRKIVQPPDNHCQLRCRAHTYLRGRRRPVQAYGSARRSLGWMACCHRLALMTDAAAGFDARPADTFASERRLAIVRLVDAQGRVRVGALSDQFGVSRQTIRKDLAVLA